MKLFHREMGEGPPVVILHGLYGSSDNWVSIARALSLEFRVLLVDQRNHGRSPHSVEHTYHHMANDLTELLDTLQLTRVNVVGHSMGGKTAMLFAHENPDRVKSLVVVDISPRGYHFPNVFAKDSQYRLHSKIISAMTLLDPQVASTRQQLDELLSKSIPDERIKQFLLKNIKRNEKGVFHWMLNVSAISNNLEAIMGPIFGDEKQTYVSTPTLFVKGERSNYLGADDELWIGERFSNYRMHTIPNTGHWLHAEAPAELTALLKNFIQSIE